MNRWFRKLFAQGSTKNEQAETTAPNAITCQEVVELVTDYLEGTLAQELQAQFEAHIADCDGCTNYVEQVRLTISMLRGLAKEPVFPETKDELLQVFRQWKSSQ